ncbi:MAG: hypothetical protein IJK61_01075 [Bacteroidetes bacterium]|nr:hypothetical protein [Bacteroidota bacterium]MBR3091041.1 hypothetical protein [Bacteroidota bacterium]
MKIIRYPAEINYISQDELFNNEINFNELLLLSNEQKVFVAKINNDKYKVFDIKKNDIIVVNVAKRLQEGNLVLTKLDDNFTIKKYKIINDEEYLSDINDIFVPLNITQVLRYEIIGVISQTIRSL